METKATRAPIEIPENFGEILTDIFKENGLAQYAEPQYIEKFKTLTEFLVEYNSHTNLTAIRDIEGIILRHYADSLAGARLIPQGAAVIDVGAGAGFPSLPLAIVRPDLKITALDSTAKKTRFTELAAEKLGLANVIALNGRAEELAGLPEYREAYDCAVSRALARMNMLCELCMPFVKISGLFLAYKGHFSEETEEAMNAIDILGGKVTASESADLKQGDTIEKHSVVIIQKNKETPIKYPRNFAKIAKKPL